MHKKLKRIAKKLNLKAHFVGPAHRPVKLFTPTDLLVNRGAVRLRIGPEEILAAHLLHLSIKDGRLYLSGFARLFPCEQPKPEYLVPIPLLNYH